VKNLARTTTAKSYSSDVKKIGSREEELKN
jgi:hypothetical protein